MSMWEKFAIKQSFITSSQNEHKELALCVVRLILHWIRKWRKTYNRANNNINGKIIVQIYICIISGFKFHHCNPLWRCSYVNWKNIDFSVKNNSHPDWINLQKYDEIIPNAAYWILTRIIISHIPWLCLPLISSQFDLKFFSILPKFELVFDIIILHWVYLSK